MILPDESAGTVRSSNVRPLVFLDIDDVLVVQTSVTPSLVLNMLNVHDDGSRAQNLGQIVDARAKQNLQALHEEFRPQYVITSSWVNELNEDIFVRAFGLIGMRFVADNLHGKWTTERSEASYRLTEIENWLENACPANDGARPFVIIDDRRSGVSLEFSHLEEHTVFCEESAGFQHAQLHQARAILLSQQ